MKTVQSLQIDIEYNNAKLKKLYNDISALEKKMKGMTQGTRAFQKASDQLGVMTANAKRLNDTIDNTGRQMVELEAQTKRNNTAFGAFWESSRMGALGFNGTLLSLLFFGMEMKRVFGGALRSIFDGYKKIIPESHKFNVMTTKLSANWEFFKFQLADAMANSKLFQRFIQFLIDIVKRLQTMNEETRVFLVAMLAVGVALGSIFFFVGVIGMGLAAMSDFATAFKLGLKSSNKELKGIKTNLDGIDFNDKSIKFDVKTKMPNGDIIELTDLKKQLDSNLQDLFKSYSKQIDEKIPKNTELDVPNYSNNLNTSFKGAWSGVKKIVSKVTDFLQKLLPKKINSFFKAFGKMLGKIAVPLDVLIGFFEAWQDVSEREFLNTTTKIIALTSSAFLKIAKGWIWFVEFVVGHIVDLFTGFLADLMQIFGLDDNVVYNFLRKDFSASIIGAASGFVENVNQAVLDALSVNPKLSKVNTGELFDMDKALKDPNIKTFGDLIGMNKRNFTPYDAPKKTFEEIMSQNRRTSSMGASDMGRGIYIIDSEGNITQGIQNDKQQSALDALNKAMTFSGN